VLQTKTPPTEQSNHRLPWWLVRQQRR